MPRTPRTRTSPMSDEEIGLPPAGHNEPPPTKPDVGTPEEIKAWLEHDADPEFRTRRTELIEGWRGLLAQWPNGIPDEDAQGKAAEFLALLQAYSKAVDARHKQEKEPYLTGGRAVDGYFNGLAYGTFSLPGDDPAKLSAEARLPLLARDRKERSVSNHLRDMMTAFATKLEAQRRAEAQEAARKAAEEAAEAARRAAESRQAEDLAQAAAANQAAQTAIQHAQAPAARHSRVVGEFGAGAGLKTTREYEITDHATLYAAAAGSPDLDTLLAWAGKAAKIVTSVEMIAEELGREFAKHGLTLRTNDDESVVSIARSLLHEISSFPRQNPRERGFVQPDTTAIRRAVVSDRIDNIPGVRVFEKRSV